MLCDICGAEAWYVCGNSGRPVCPQHSRIEIVSRLSFGSSDGMVVREADNSDYAKIKELEDYLRKCACITQIDKNYNLAESPALVINANNHFAGVLSYFLEGDALVIGLLNVMPGHQGLGAGKMLLEAAKAKVTKDGHSCILITTSNDDLPSIYFFQRNGFRIYEVKPNLMAERNGELRVGFGGIPCLDEIRLRWDRA